MDGAAYCRHLHGRSHVGEQIVIAPAARHGDGTVRRVSLDLEGEARVVFKLTPEARREVEAIVAAQTRTIDSLLARFNG